MKNLLYTILVLLVGLSLHGQNTPSAAASSVQKAADAPVNLNNGTANVVIPIYQISEYDLSIPISISNQTGGLKVSEISSNIGRGWTLNAGGVVSRKVNGLPDDSTFGYLANGESFDINDPDPQDTEPDIFYLHFNGYSAKFILAPNGDVRFLDQSDAKITYTREMVLGVPGKLLTFDITLPDGTHIIFGGNENGNSYREKTYYNNNNEFYYSAFFALQYTSVSGRKVNFNYDLDAYHIKSLNSGTRMVDPTSWISDFIPIDPLGDVEETYIVSPRITSINAPETTVIFNVGISRTDLEENIFLDHAYSIGEILVNTSDLRLIKKVTFEQSIEFSSLAGFDPSWPDLSDRKWLKLSKVNEVANDNSDAKYTYSLDYYNEADVPRRLSHSQDLWGYHNGKFSNKSLFPRVNFYAKGCLPSLNLEVNQNDWLADRTPDLESTKAGSIKRITYPNGQFKEFIYEQNTIYGDKYVPQSEPTHEHQILSQFNSNDCAISNPEYQMIFEEILLEDDKETMFHLSMEQFECSPQQGYKVKLSSKLSSETNFVFKEELEIFPSKDYLDKVYYKADMIEVLGMTINNNYDVKVDIFYDSPNAGTECKTKGLIHKMDRIAENTDVGGLRIAEIISSEKTVEYNYDSDNSTPPEPEEYSHVRLKICSECPGNPPGNGGQSQSIPGPDWNYVCSGYTSTWSNGVYVPCNASGASVKVFAIPDCEEDLWLLLKWRRNDPINAGYDIEDQIPIFVPANASSNEVLDQTFDQLGILPGFVYDFNLKLTTANTGVRASANISIPIDTYETISHQGTPSSGTLTSYPNIIAYDYFANGTFHDSYWSGILPLKHCISNPHFYIYTHPYGYTNSLNGSHILYGRVEEQVKDEAFGKTVYTFDTGDSERPANFIKNLMDPTMGVYPGFPFVNELHLSPLVGTLTLTEVFDENGNLVSSSEKEYAEISKPIEFLKVQFVEQCDGEFDPRFIHYYLRNQTLLLNKQIDVLDGVSTETRYDYDPDFRHLNPVRITTFATNSTSMSKVKDIKYAHEVGNQDMINRNMISIPLETLIDEGAGGGSKVEYANFSGIPKPYKYYVATWDASSTPELGWKEMSRINSYFFNLPASVKRRSHPKNFIYTYANGQLSISTYESRTTKYIYDGLRRLVRTDYPDGSIEQVLQYDGFNRVQKRASYFGKIITTMGYDISPAATDYITTHTTYADPDFDITDRISIQQFDQAGRQFQSTNYGYNFSGSDYVTGASYDALGAAIMSCDPGSGGCTQNTFDNSPLHRIISTIPAGSTKSIDTQYGANAQNEIANYAAGTLFKNTTIDENGKSFSKFTDIFGRHIASMDPDGNVTLYSYNRRDQLILTTPPDLSAGELTDNTFSYSYYPDGLLESKKIPNKGTYTYVYDPDNDNLLEESMPNGSKNGYVYETNFPDFLKEVYLDYNLVKTFLPYHADFKTNWVKEEQVKILGSTEWLSTIYDYDVNDNIGQLDRVVSTFYEGGQSTTDFVYDVLGNVRNSTRNHTGLNGDAFTVVKENDYAQGIWLQSSTGRFPIENGIYSSTGNIDLTLASFNYDDRGWMTRKTLGGGLESLNYRYHPRGWLRSINSVESAEPIDSPPCFGDPTNPTDFCRGPFTEVELEVLLNCDDLFNEIPTTVKIKREVFRVQGENRQSLGLEEMIFPFNGALADHNTTYTEAQSYGYVRGESAPVLPSIQDLIIKCLGIQEDGPVKLMNDSQLDNIAYSLSGEGNANEDDPIPGDPTEDTGPHLFGLELHYTNGNSALGADPYYNGNISWMEWQTQSENTQQYGFVYDNLYRLTNANYKGNDPGQCEVVPDGAYDVTIGYNDARGNISSITRNGVLSFDQEGVPDYGTIDMITMDYDGNVMTSSADAASTEKGHLAASSSPVYTNGNLTSDGTYSSIVYNELDLPVQIVSAGGTMDLFYTADGAQVKSVLNPTVGATLTTYYQGGVEYIQQGTQPIRRAIIHHEEGRIVYQAEIANPADDPRMDYPEWSIQDHLGNVRVCFADKDNDGTITVTLEVEETNELTNSFHYYPFGMRMEGTFVGSQGVKEKYQYNGIEHIDVLGSGVSLATYRSLDASLGRWWQVDPKAELLYGMSPYNSMNNNPITMSDPEGDLPFLALVGIGAATGIFSNGLSNISQGNNFFDGAGKAALWGGIGAAASFGIGSAFGATGSFGKELGRAGAHAVSSGIQSELSGGSFGQGFLSGGISSGIGSGLSGQGAGAQIFGGGVGGGIGSSISGGNFFEGFGQGVAVGAFNHALHSGAEAIESSLDNGDPPWIKRMLRQRDSEAMAKAYGGEASEYYERLRGIEGDAAVDAAIWGSSFTGIGVGFGMMARSTRLGTWAFNSKYLGVSSKLFGRYHKIYFPNNAKGILNRGFIRLGWNANNGRHVFRAAMGKPRSSIHFDILRGPKW